jgi:signal peptidase
MTSNDKIRKNIKNKLVYFWRTDNNKISIVRDILVAFLLVLIILTALWTYTGQWLGAPMVAIESGSMMHLDEPYGRIGTINAGDMVLLVKVNKRSEISTYIDKDSDNQYYGKYGDVIVYRPYGDVNRDQIIHRAMCWVDYDDEYGTYTVEGYGVINQTSITIPELGLNKYVVSRNPHSGYITKGDNPVTNDRADQAPGGICNEPIKLEWVSGKARGELPWIGTLNLLFNDIIGGKNTIGNVQTDCISCLILLLEFLIFIPISLDAKSHYKFRKEQLLGVKKNPQFEINNIGSSQQKITDRSLLESLASVLIVYWMAFILLIIIYMFFIVGFIGLVIHFIFGILVHIMFLYIFNISGRLLKTGDLRNWLILVIFTGPIGMTIFYFVQLNRLKIIKKF